MDFDLFISHASEDKNDFVRPVADTLKKLGVRVWYDEFSLSIGDSLSKSIDRGLIQSNFGLVVLSKSFLGKNWPDYELRSLLSKEIGSGKVILPIWHDIKREDILNFSPFLADKFALTSSGLSIIEIAAKILKVVRPDRYDKLMRRVAFCQNLRTNKVENIPVTEIVFTPPKHDKLPFNLLSRVRLIRAALFEVYPHSMEYWVDGFRGDAHPSREIRIWEHIAACYLEYCAKAQPSQSEKVDIFNTLYEFSVFGISEESASKIEGLERFWASPVPTFDIADDKFPESYHEYQGKKDDEKFFDTESFPYDIPDELAFELLDQMPIPE
ncbi:MAG: toll/interleukin-1 receptor domain-containing protein [Methylocystaceae bacterium]|nr:toll/interleukin-1 receptor domain-containing protein [Methylocystaceae bacterium]